MSGQVKFGPVKLYLVNARLPLTQVRGNHSRLLWEPGVVEPSPSCRVKSVLVVSCRVSLCPVTLWQRKVTSH